MANDEKIEIEWFYVPGVSVAQMAHGRRNCVSSLQLRHICVLEAGRNLSICNVIRTWAYILVWSVSQSLVKSVSTVKGFIDWNLALTMLNFRTNADEIT